MAATAQPMDVSDIDQALWFVVVSAPRDAHYHRIVDALLDQRNRLTQGLPPYPAPLVSAEASTEHPDRHHVQR